jgi:leader peptidase (prepilin peptidase) / N-methyltransferase
MTAMTLMMPILNDLPFIVILIPLLLCWGSFLNVVAYRIIRGENIVRPRSHCPKCHHQIAWYDNIPVISWLALCGKCRHCKKPISWLYPAIELFTTATLLALFIAIPIAYIFAYFIFFSALIVTIRSDIETMLISRFFTLFLIPLGLLFSLIGLLPITGLESILSAIAGYGFLYLFAELFRLLTHKEGMGQGDLELLAFIGSFTGIAGCWFSLMIGSITGSLFGLFSIIVLHKTKTTKIPFGPFLAIGAMTYVLFSQQLLAFILG